MAIICNHDLGRWLELSGDGGRAGLIGPYGFEHLAAAGNCALTWSDAKHRRPWTFPLVRRIAAKIEWVRPELAGWAAWLVSLRAVRGADLVLAVFEDQGLAGASARRVGLLRRKRLVVVVCWAADRVDAMSAQTRDRVAQALREVDVIIVYSRNQIDILAEAFRLDRAKIHFVPFGIDASFFGHQELEESSDYVLFVGRDRSRDLDTLLEAAPAITGEILVVTSRELLGNRSVPQNVTPVFNIDHIEYRALLRGSRVVCVPTHAPAYPGGQTVLLEAMATGRPCVTTASPAVRDYVEDGQTGLLTAPHDAAQVAQAVNLVLNDVELARRLGNAARAEVERRFNHRHMWARFVDAVDARDWMS